MNSLIPYRDIGEYVCVVENEWETVNRSIIISFELLKGSELPVNNYSRVLHSVMYEFLPQILFKLPHLLQYSTCLKGLTLHLDVSFKLIRTDQIMQRSLLI